MQRAIIRSIQSGHSPNNTGETAITDKLSTGPVLSYRSFTYLALCGTPLMAPLVVHVPNAYLSPSKGSLTPLTWTTGTHGEILDPRAVSPLLGSSVGSLAPFAVNTKVP